MSLVLDDVLVSSNPATGAEVGRIKITPAGRVAELVARARAAQQDWGSARGSSGAGCWPGGGRSLAVMSAIGQS